MIDNTDVVTYFSANAPHEDLQWTAYVVLSNGEYWGVRFSSSNEEAVIAKAVSFFNSEKAKVKAPDPWSEIKAEVIKSNHHIANKVWMRHATEGLKRIPLTEITMYEKLGYYRSGPRGK